MSTREGRRLHIEFEEACDAARELTIDALQESLTGSLVGLGYQVGCGAGPTPSDARYAAERIFERFKSLIGLTISEAGDPRRQATIDFVRRERRQ